MGGGLSFPILTQHIERVNTNLFRAACTHVNGLRPSQEDDHIIKYDVNDHGMMVFAVFDGHGGRQAAELSANHIIDRCFKTFSALTDRNTGSELYWMQAPAVDYEKLLTERLLDFDKWIMNKCADGCTGIIVLGQPWDLEQNRPITDKQELAKREFSFEQRDKMGIKLITLNIGDSRAILLPLEREHLQPHDTFEQLSHDHKPSNPVEWRRITDANGFVQMNRVDGNLALSRAFGDRTYKDAPHLPADRQKVIAVPDYHVTMAKYGDTLFLACDGIFESSPLEQHQNVVQTLLHHKQDYRAELQRRFELPNQPQRHTDVDGTTYQANHVDLLDLLYEPAELSRDIIQESIGFGSNDNHTALVVSFTTLNSLDSILQRPLYTNNQKITDHVNFLKSAPRLEIIPGPIQEGITTTFEGDVKHSHLLALCDNEAERTELIYDALSTERINILQTAYLDLQRGPDFYQNVDDISTRYRSIRALPNGNMETPLAVTHIENCGHKYYPSTIYANAKTQYDHLMQLNQECAKGGLKPFYATPMYLFKLQTDEHRRREHLQHQQVLAMMRRNMNQLENDGF